MKGFWERLGNLFTPRFGEEGENRLSTIAAPKPEELPLEDISKIEGLLELLIRTLEIGAVDNSILNKVFQNLDDQPDALLPRLQNQFNQAAFLLFKCNRGDFAKRMLFTCLAWHLKNPADPEDAASIIRNIQYILEKEGQPALVEQIREQALSGRFGHAASYRLDIAAFSEAKPIVDITDGEPSLGRTKFSGGLTPLVSARLPLTTFQGWLKRHNPAVLNAAGRLTMRDVFPLFSEPTPEEFLARSERLLALNVPFSPSDLAEISTLRRLRDEGVPLKMRRHRRYAGGDGLLPRGCYSTICKNARGNDEGALSRELFAYVDPRLPGVVYIGDSTSEKLSASFQIGVSPGYCAAYVLLLAPQETDQKLVYEAVYADLLAELGGASSVVSVVAFETQVDECIIENVIDLRLPATQLWFFDHFKNGDGVFLTKSGGTAREFYDLLPTLLHPALGGNDITNAMGSFMRSSGVNALIYPSARSDASVTLNNGAVVDWHGWNLLDYHEARAIPGTEITESHNGWPNFVQPGATVEVANSGERAGSWRVSGLEGRYNNLRRQIEGPESGRST